MKKSDFIFLLVATAIFLPFFISDDAYEWYKTFNATHGMVMSFLKFAILSTMGEMIGLRISTGVYINRTFGIIPRMVVWGLIGIIFKLIRHSRSFRVIGKALASVKEELETAYTASFITICFSAILMYYIERSAQPEVFENIGDGIWWAIITFATVGYGDIYPITPLGKLLGCIICLVGVAMVAIPTGIISSSFINIVQKKEKKQGEDCNNESDKQ